MFKIRESPCPETGLSPFTQGGYSKLKITFATEVFVSTLLS
jgi:hypothetical protein